ncbi:MAG: sulfite exporter TauE/SafE family protein [Kiritimatiellae bacterium]|nr:sulfite exporter TauE/SafE family protein [Kiritimatiellia bacterium]
MEHYFWLIPLGFALGAAGTLIGVGGGFILVPVLLLLYPYANPETITSISLAVVFFNALSGSWAYARMKRIDYKSGLLFAAAAIPGAIIGALTTDYIPRRLFDAVFGLLMIVAATYLFFHRIEEINPGDEKSRRHMARNIVEINGTVHAFSYNLKLGMGLSAFVGYVSSLLGIGGGIVHVPVLVRLLNFPVHIATATSHFMLAIMALTATIVHMAKGSFSHGGVHLTIYIAIGVLLGAQVGAALSTRVHGMWIIRGLAVALIFVGVRILVMAL